MNDQLAAGILWREFLRRAHRSHAGTDLGATLERAAAITAEDVETFERMMGRLGLRRNPFKTGLAAASAYAAWAKARGRFAQLDFIVIGVVGKKILWENLRDLAELDTRLPDVDFDELIARADTQIELLEPFRAEAGRAELGRSFR